MTCRRRRPFILGVAAPLFAALCVLNLSSNIASASTISIAISVVDLVFDGTDIVDAGSPISGTGDIADANPVDTMVFQMVF